MRKLSPSEWDRLYDEYEAACAELDSASASISDSVRAGKSPSAEQHQAKERAAERLAEARRKLSLAHVDPPAPTVDPGATEPNYSGEERRFKSARPETLREIKFDEKGNAVLEWSIDTPRRRESDDTIDLIECLDPEGLSLVDDVKAEQDDYAGGFNPYDKNKKAR
jgi:hypothetical protein